MPSDYWSRRADMNYYRRVEHLAREFAPRGSLLDVGAGVLAGAKYLERFADWSPIITVEKWGANHSIEGVTTFRQNFSDWHPPEQQFDLVLCLQLLEHLDDATVVPFAEKLLAVGETLIVSVSYKWPKGREPGHLQDPIDEAKFLRWFPRRPKSIEVCRETGTSLARLIAVF